MERKHLDLQRADGWILASTPAVDRDRDRVMPLGIDLTNFRKNPVMFYGHDYASPYAVIGRAAEIEQTETGLRIRPELRAPVGDGDPMHVIRALWDGGLLRAASIGFVPMQAEANEFGGRDILTSELLEISLVPLPANQDALRLALKALTAAGDAEADTAGPAATADGDGEVPIPTLPEFTQQDDAERQEEQEQPAPPEDDDAGESPAGDPADGGGADPAAEQEAWEVELRLAAILAEFIDSVRPYLLAQEQSS